jgi:hypothetical protein
MVKGVSTEHLLSLLSMIADAENNIKRASHQRYLLETVVLRMANVKAIARVSDIVEMLKNPGMAGGQGAPGGSGKTGAAGAPGRSGKTGAKGAGGSGGTSPGKSGKPPQAGGPSGSGGESGRQKPGRAGAAGGAVNTLQADPDMSPSKAQAAVQAAVPDGAQAGDVIQSWQDVIEHLRETKIGLASILDLCEPPKLSEGVYWINVPSQFHQSQVRKGQNMRILTEHVQKITNTSVTLKTRVKVMEDPVGAPERGPADAAGPQPEEMEVGGAGSGYGAGPGYDSGPAYDDRPAPESRRKTGAPIEPQAADIASVVEKDPVVKALVENLGGKVVGIRRRKESPEDETAA